jgi:hypothetical protein
MSFFAPQKGFACDGVESFEIVIADGSIITASSSENSDLWLALRGGSNNFGIVTSFTLTTFPQGLFWGGQVFYPDSTIDDQFSATYNFAIASGNGEDDNTTIINAYVYIGSEDTTIVANSYENTAAIENPPILKNFASITPVYSDTTRITNLTSLTVELGDTQTNGYRQLFAVTTILPNATLFAAAYNITQSLYEPFHSVDGFQSAFIFQSISKAVLRASAASSGNSLGLSADENLIWINFDIQWSDESADEGIIKATEAIISQIEALAKEWGLYSE